MVSAGGHTEMTVHTIIGWGTLLGLGLAAAVYAAQAQEPVALLGTCALVNLLVAAVGVNERRRLSSAGANRSLVEATTARYMGMLWLWGGAALILIYVLVLYWREWSHFSAAFVGVGLLCFGFSWMLSKDAAQGREDETLLKIGRYLGIGQLVGMIATMIGLGIDPNKEFLLTRKADWAGNAIFLFGALGLAIVSAHALIDARKKAP